MTHVGNENSERIKRWRIKSKQRMIEAFGSQCCICGYNKCNQSLAFHHLDPADKDLNIGRVIANPRKWETIVKELRKCVMLCHNCHSEVHAGVTVIPVGAKRFDENFADLKNGTGFIDECPVCHGPKSTARKVCSRSCSAAFGDRIEWTYEKLDKVASGEQTMNQFGGDYGVTGASVTKALKKFGRYEEYIKNRSLKLRPKRVCKKCSSKLFESTEGNICRKCIDGYEK